MAGWPPQVSRLDYWFYKRTYFGDKEGWGLSWCIFQFSSFAKRQSFLQRMHAASDFTTATAFYSGLRRQNTRSFIHAYTWWVPTIYESEVWQEDSVATVHHGTNFLESNMIFLERVTSEDPLGSWNDSQVKKADYLWVIHGYFFSRSIYYSHYPHD